MLNDSLKIWRHETKNRLVMPPMQTNRTENNRVTGGLLDYYRDRARYTAPGLIVTEHLYISGPGRAAGKQLSIAEDDTIDGHRRLSEVIHAEGSLVIAQINHAGSAADPADGSQPVSASGLAHPRAKGAPPRPLRVDEILALEDVYVQAALRAVRAGYDGVELHAAHGYLFNQFYSPLTNRRDDAYGCGSVENRCRFLLETAAKVRDAIGAGPILAVRLGGSDYTPGGSTEEDAVEACRLIEAQGADLLDLSGGMCGYTRAGHDEPGYFGSMTEKIKAAVSIPVILTGGVTRRAEAEQLLADGKADLIGVGRALFQDAHLGEQV